MTIVPEPRQHDTPLALKLKERIRRDGPISVAAYMAAALGDAEQGYYVNGTAIGAGGDFITAPEISQVFGELLGLWSAVVWHGMGQPAAVHLVELGPGRGTLMRDALRAARIVPGFADAIAVHLVETNKPMQEEQRAALAGSARVSWHADPQSLPAGPMIVLANELLDALAVAQIVHHDGQWCERQVGLDDDGRFTFVVGEPTGLRPPPGIPERAPEGAICEVATGARDMLGALAARTGGAPFALLAIDYGHTRSALGDTLQGVSRHAYCSPFEAPGETDLTAQVDFEQVGAIAMGLGLGVDGPLIQAELLGRLGIMERTSHLMAANPVKAASLEAGVARLMAPNGMGSRFKAIGLRSQGVAALPGF